MNSVALPWSSKGASVGTAKTSAEAIGLAGMDWEVRKEHMYITVEEQGNTYYETVPNKVAIVRNDNDAILGVVGDGYQIFQNKEQFEFFDGFVQDKYAMYQSAGVLGDGQRTWIIAKLPSEILVAPDDVVGKYILLASSHDGTLRLTMASLPLRFWCSNILNSIGIRRFKREIRIRHSGNLESKINSARKAFGLTLQYYDNLGQSFKFMASRKVDNEYVTSVVHSLVPLLPDADDATVTRVNRVRSKVFDLFENGRGNSNPAVRHTRWTLYNAFTEYADHGLKYRDTGKTDMDSKRLESIWFGRSRKLKQKAFDLLTIN